MFFIILNKAIATPIPIPVDEIQINKVLLTIGIITSICFAKTASAGSATVASKPNPKPNPNTKIILLYLAKASPTIRPMGRILVSSPTKNKDNPITTEIYPIIILT